MIVKSCLAAASAVALVSASPAPQITYDDQRTATQFPLVKQVECDRGSGTAFRIGRTRFLSVAHVTSLGHCKIEGKRVRIIEQDGKNDFSILEADLPRGGAFKINCGGFHTSEWYISVGYAWGLPIQTTVAINATAFDHENGMRIFTGKHTVIPGMSGGPVLNSAGEVVGTVNMYHPFFGLSMSRELKETSVCQSSDSARR